jgi:hypothetical protein
MGHHITGVIVRPDALADPKGKFAGQPRYTLAEGLAFLPLDDKNLDAMAGLHKEKAISNFVLLTPRLFELLRGESIGGEFAYVETEYFGGKGGQGAVLFRHGEVAFGPAWVEQDIGPINEVLLRMGVTLKPERIDAFEAVGLRAYRSNDAFRNKAALA